MLNREASAGDRPIGREVKGMRLTGQTEVDLAIFSYDEKLAAGTAPAGVRESRTPRTRNRRRLVPEGRRLLMARKAIDVRA